MDNQQNIDAWSQVPQSVIDDFGDEGDFGRQHILNPQLLRLIGDPSDKAILDAGCGNGYLSRKLAALGAIVTGVEPAQTLFDNAISREQEHQLNITYLQQDLSHFHQPEVFDIVVSNMVFMDIPDWQSAVQNCIDALRPGGLLVFSISHPAFDTSTTHYKEVGYLQIEDYFHESTKAAVYGQSFHRPLSTYLNFVINHGCIITEVVEPQLTKNEADQFPDHRRTHYIPNYLVIAAIKHE